MNEAMKSVLAAMKSDLVEVTVKIHQTTERAVLVSVAGDVEDAVWLALFLVEIEAKPNGFAEVTMPECLAKARGLI